MLSRFFSFRQNRHGTHHKLVFFGIIIRFPRLKYYLMQKEIRRRMQTSKVVHLMINDKFTRPFVEFLNRNFDNNEHMVLCTYCTGNDHIAPEWFPVGKNVYPVLFLKELDFSSAKKVIVHSLFDDDVVDLFYTHPDWLAKSYWEMWGPDLYKAKRDTINDFVRTNFKGYIGKNDEAYAKNKYGMKGIFFDATYNFPTSKKCLDSAVKKDSQYIRIQINHRCSSSTLDMLNILKKFKKEKVLIRTVVSYGPEKQKYRPAIIELGKKIFADRFEYLDTFLPPQEYSEHLAQNDIFLLCQNTAQGVGNTLASLYLGTKVYMRQGLSTWGYLKDQGIVLYDLETIESLSFEEFIAYDSQKENQRRVASFFEESKLAAKWNKIFTDEPC